MLTPNFPLVLMFLESLLIATPAMATGSGVAALLSGVICLLTLPLKWFVYAGVLKNTIAYANGEQSPGLLRKLVVTRMTIGAVLFIALLVAIGNVCILLQFRNSYALCFGIYLLSSSLSWVITFVLQSRADRSVRQFNFLTDLRTLIGAISVSVLSNIFQLSLFAQDLYLGTMR